MVIPEGRSGPQLHVEWGWHDWLEPEGPGNEPMVVTPLFVAEAISFALLQGWQPTLTGTRFSISYSGGHFLSSGQEA